MSLGNLEISILLPAFLAGLLVLATHVPLGQQVLRRGIVFIDLAIAQVAGLGVTAADAFGFAPEGWRVQVAAVTAALIGAIVLTWTEKKWPEAQEALIGVLFVVAACGERLILADNPHGGEHLRDGERERRGRRAAVDPACQVGRHGRAGQSVSVRAAEGGTRAPRGRVGADRRASRPARPRARSPAGRCSGRRAPACRPARAR